MQPEIPHISRPIIGGFQWFLRRYLRQHFHTFAANFDRLGDTHFSVQDSLVVYANHASWWDPLTAFYLAEQTFPKHRLYAPIDARMLMKYPMFSKMGFYSIDRSSRRGAVDFLRTSVAILKQDAASIWLTPEGRFVDPRDRGAQLAGGLSHLAVKLSTTAASAPDESRTVWFVPGAVEYTFWEESKPELLCWFGQPTCVTAIDCERDLAGASRTNKRAWHDLLSERLRSAQAELATASIARDASQFRILQGGASGTFFVYDWWRRCRSIIQRQPFDRGHSDKLQP